MQLADEGFLAGLVRSAKRRVEEGYYKVKDTVPSQGLSLVEALGRRDRIPVMAEIKFRSPAYGTLREAGDAPAMARDYEAGGAAAISVLTEPENFGGDIRFLSSVRGAVRIPLMMKDVIVDVAQIGAARSYGADVVLLIARVFNDEFEVGSLEEMVGAAHGAGLQTVVEAFDREEYDAAMSSESDVVGINNRDLDTIGVSLDVSRKLLSAGPHPKPVICESGISTRGDIDELRGLGADGFLVGSALMKSSDPRAELKRLTSI